MSHFLEKIDRLNKEQIIRMKEKDLMGLRCEL